MRGGGWLGMAGHVRAWHGGGKAAHGIDSHGLGTRD